MNGILGLRFREPIFRFYPLQELQLSTRIFRIHQVPRMSPSLAPSVMVYQPLSVDIQQQSLPYDTFSASYASKEYEFLNRFVALRIRNQSMSVYRCGQLSIDKFRLFTDKLAYQILSVQVN